MGCPGLWKYTAEPSLKRLPVSKIDLMFLRCFPVCQTLSRWESEDPGKGCQEPGCSHVRLCCAAEPCGVQSIARAGDMLTGCTESWGEVNTFLPAPLDVASSLL